MPSSAAIWRRIIDDAPQQRAAGAARRRAGPGRSRSRARAGRAAARSSARVARGRRPSACRRRQRGGGRGGLDLARAGRCARPSRSRRRSPPMSRNGSFGRPGHERERGRSPPPATSGALRWRRICPAMSLPRSFSEADAGDDDAGRDRDQQRRDLRGEAVADGQQREVLGGVAERHVPCCSDADDDAADQVDQRDDDARPSRRP